MISIAPMHDINWKQFHILETEAFPGNEMTESSYQKSRMEDGFVGLFLNQNLIGYLFMKSNRNECHIKKMAVDPGFQRRGYGRSLLQWAITFCKSKNGQSISLFVNVDNTAAVSLYQKIGFKTIETTWQYIIYPEKLTDDKVEPDDLGHYISELQVNEIEDIVSLLPALNIHQVRRWLKSENSDKLVVLKHREKIKAFGKYSPTKSGCMPFVYTELSDIDHFIQLMKKDYLQDHDQIKLSFAHIEPEIINLHKRDGYEIFKKLYKMELQLI